VNPPGRVVNTQNENVVAVVVVSGGGGGAGDTTHKGHQML